MTGFTQMIHVTEAETEYQGHVVESISEHPVFAHIDEVGHSLVSIRKPISLRVFRYNFASLHHNNHNLKEKYIRSTK